MIHSIFFAKDTLALALSLRPLCHICSQLLSRPDYLLEFHWFHVLHLLYPRISWRSLHSFHPFHSFHSFHSFGSLQIPSVHLFMSPAAKISGLLLSDHWWESGHAYFWGCLHLSAPASTCEWPTINPKTQRHLTFPMISLPPRASQSVRPATRHLLPGCVGLPLVPDRSQPNLKHLDPFKHPSLSCEIIPCAFSIALDLNCPATSYAKCA